MQIIDLCPHVGLPKLTATAVTMIEGTTITIPLDDLDPQYVGWRTDTSSEGGIDLTFPAASAGITPEQTGVRDIRVISTLGQTGAKTFTVRLEDKKGVSNTVTVSVTVQPVELPPGGDDLNDAYGLVAKNTVGNVHLRAADGRCPPDPDRNSNTVAKDASGNDSCTAPM